MRLAVLMRLGAVVLMTSSCSVAPEEQAAERVATQFVAAAGSNTPAACALLAPQTRAELEDQADAPCVSALTEEDLPSGTSVRSVAVAGHSAQVRLPDQAIFLARFDEGWRVTAAGCTRDDVDSATPYDCPVKGD